MSDSEGAVGTRFVLTATAETLSDDRPCAYCNPDDAVSEREQMAYEQAAEKGMPEFKVPDDVGLVSADYILRFGHENGAGVEVPVCDMCLDGVPVEHDGQTALSELDFEYNGNGTVAEVVTEERDDGGEVVRRIPVGEE